jgi:FKBP-type peptidyl-prolyl cis-trans isomerase SlyD
MVGSIMNISKNLVVSFDYTLTDENKQVLDSSSGSGPLSYLHGFENIIPGLEKELEGKTEGDAFTVTVPAAEAYGERDERLVANIPLNQFEDSTVVEAGMQFQAETPDGDRIVTVIKVANDMATIDANHPLAGMDLTFDVKIAAIREATAEELEHGHPHHEGGCGGCGGSCGGHGDEGCDCDGDDDCEGGCGCGHHH